ncbi:hypothetical protein DNK47_00605 [Mycoplasma wenyonii]|uniref:Uncharacterized protein n=1 Tax=Mycoplasma wenyonii TaxID=65123 RepID=A0A328PQ91_9MOLU|nr:hypothetical protein DNK47_00605 [Mycoplasma wenyonii]
MYWEKLIYDLWEQSRTSDSNIKADDLVDDICKTWSLKKWETHQQQRVEVEYKAFLNISKQEDTKLERPIKQFFENDDILAVNLSSIEKWIDIFKYLPLKPNIFTKKFDYLLYRKTSIQDPIIRKELAMLFSENSEIISIWLNGILARKKDYIFNAKTRVETLTTLLLAENGITWERSRWGENEDIFCLPSWGHKNIDSQKIIFSCVRTNLSMTAGGGKKRERNC